MIVKEIEKAKEFKFQPFTVEITFDNLEELEEMINSMKSARSSLTGNLYDLLTSKTEF